MHIDKRSMEVIYEETSWVKEEKEKQKIKA